MRRLRLQVYRYGQASRSEEESDAGLKSNLFVQSSEMAPQEGKAGNLYTFALERAFRELLRTFSY